MTTRLDVDLGLIRKYDRPGPRYTSYPTAPHFSPDFDRGRLLREISETNTASRPLSLYLHLPFCETLCWFCGCTTIITKDRRRAPAYLDLLEKEIRLTAPLLHPERPVVQLHFGGGTPNFLDPAEIRRLGECLHHHFSFAESAECSVEIDPRRLTRDHLAAFREIGVTRASFGVQDVDPLVQEAINRIQPTAVSEQAITWMKELDYESFSIDLIYGLPGQTVASFSKTLDTVLAWRPDRLAVFSYAHVPWMKPAQKLVEKAVLPTPETKLTLLKTVVETLTSQGYHYIGMDHFARDGDDLQQAREHGGLQRNFQGYSTHGGADIHAFGISAISQLPGHYRQNFRDLPSYTAALGEDRLPIARACFLTADDRIRQKVIMRLMCDLRLDFDCLSAELAIDFRDYFRDALDRLAEPAADGLVDLRPDRLVVTDTGRLLLRNLAMAFDAYLKPDERRFSRTV
ncbi:MAG: oxygen-independent coproporphyrinogen III oxidase [Puniceicoccaceae bacterium]|nr:MAG: oxygen-independent coproporphyrinogen III oxidase [Puniceicoccaceae bacterium]